MTTTTTLTRLDTALERPLSEVQREFRRDNHAPQAARIFTAGFLTAHRIDDDTVYTAQLLVSEAVTNAALYADRGRITVAIRVDGKQIRADVTDAGRSRADAALDADFDEESEHGRGWHILAELATECGIERIGGGNGNRIWFVVTAGGAL